MVLCNDELINRKFNVGSSFPESLYFLTQLDIMPQQWYSGYGAQQLAQRPSIEPQLRQLHFKVGEVLKANVFTMSEHVEEPQAVEFSAALHYSMPRNHTERYCGFRL